MRALRSVVRMVLLQTRQKFFFLQWLIAMRTLVADFDVQRVFQYLAQANGRLLWFLRKVSLKTFSWDFSVWVLIVVTALKDFVEVVILNCYFADCWVSRRVRLVAEAVGVVNSFLLFFLLLKRCDVLDIFLVHVSGLSLAFSRVWISSSPALWRWSFALTEHERLIVGTVSNLITREVFVLKLVPELLDLLQLHAKSARLEHPAVNNFNLTQRLKFIANVLQQLSRKADHLWAVCLVHRQRRSKNLEPEAVNDFSHVLRPVGFMHLHDDVIGRH